MKSLADEGKKQLGSGIVALVATSEDGKGSIVVGQGSLGQPLPNRDATMRHAQRAGARAPGRRRAEAQGKQGGTGSTEAASE